MKTTDNIKLKIQELLIQRSLILASIERENKNNKSILKAIIALKELNREQFILMENHLFNITA